MTREKRTELIRHLRYNRSIGADYLITDEDADEIIKALEQEPCVTMRDLSEEELKHFSEEMKRIRPQVVEQEPKTGHWIIEVWNNKEHHTCSNCQHVVTYEPCYHYCPYCGAKMVEPQESEGKR